MKRGSAARSRAPKRGPYAKADETRERIFAAALDVAREASFYGTSLATVALRAGTAIGNVHYHFGSRDELLRELMHWIHDRMLAEVLETTRSGGDAFAIVESGVRADLRFRHRYPGYVRLGEEVRWHDPKLYRSTLATWLSRWRDLLREGIARGEFRRMSDAEIATAAHFLVGSRYFLDQMIEGVDGRDYPGDEAVVAAYMNLVRDGLRKTEKRER